MTNPESNIVLTCIAHGATIDNATIFKSINGILQNQINESTVIDTKTLSVRAFDIYIHTMIPVSALKTLFVFEDVDVIVQHNDVYRQNKKLFVFDMDSTLIYQEVIELIASYANVEDQVREITNRAMNNEIDFKESLRERVKLLTGLRIDTLYDKIKLQLRITNGVKELCQFLKVKGCKLAVLSGGFIQFATFIKDQLEFDFAKANLLEMDSNGNLTGNVLGEIVDGQCKADTLKQLCKEYNVKIEESCMVGDGGNDLPAMGTAGFGIAWNAKPKVQEVAPCKLNTDSLRDVLYILGYTDDEIKSTTTTTTTTI
ncbi:phosphoserine phosphatase NDAI_0D02310 [Naumovozyma dairenensis CBS 421]|uniref:phosphoserine phosphatase n=1 Tax=Naumovozyma dairenensis (strain ATCC 10597 / BCRC 20456 / CBS 421 / NBRC 0211 / NRRL Y-12639) TaxID=1071378 RepID=G0W9T4_NAUDC|nr:hypothetical protein NDAI_0D02310 [Naumovozyma dairenensis CBS 421]CCD24545.1 hypothetical protein NDAI_0D02310 [Naumovozyma dairenensis CBS 421]